MKFSLITLLVLFGFTCQSQMVDCSKYLNLKSHERVEKVRLFDSTIHYLTDLIDTFELEEIPKTLNKTAYQLLQTSLTNQIGLNLIEFDNLHEAALFKMKPTDTTISRKQFRIVVSRSFVVKKEDQARVMNACLLRLYNDALPLDTIRYYLEKVENVSTTLAIFKEFENYMDEAKFNKYDYVHSIRRNFELVKEHLNLLITKQFVQYSYLPASKRLIKGVYFGIDNDTFFPYKNEDRNYTGGGRLEVTTDFLKMRFYPGWPKWKFLRRWNPSNYLGYQGLFYGVEVYTPNIRDTNIFVADSSFDSLDRPFASIQYFGRAKYRISNDGFNRSTTYLKLGQIGGSAGNSIQSTIHRDVTVGSLRPNGWSSQIASTGRFAYNYEKQWEFMLLSGDGDLFNHYRGHRDRGVKKCGKHKGDAKKQDWKDFMHFSLIAEGQIGNIQTSYGGGLSFSTRSFKQKSAHNDIRLDKNPNFNWMFTATARLRYVQHNSALEGVGVFKTRPDEHPSSPIDLYVIGTDSIERTIGLMDFSAVVSTKKMSVMYQLSFISQEFTLQGQREKGWHWWARIRLSYLI
ncbi:MAG: hypothetical protein COB85_02345 [Bacteroidetes bacterium]|nr:MAG: hypothetical protein COB85_02345 [Bacteroidota bacterium]